MYKGLDGVNVPAWVTNVAFLRDTVMAQAALHGWDWKRRQRLAKAGMAATNATGMRVRATSGHPPCYCQPSLDPY